MEDEEDAEKGGICEVRVICDVHSEAYKYLLLPVAGIQVLFSYSFLLVEESYTEHQHFPKITSIIRLDRRCVHSEDVFLVEQCTSSPLFGIF